MCSILTKLLQNVWEKVCRSSTHLYILLLIVVPKRWCRIIYLYYVIYYVICNCYYFYCKQIAWVIFLLTILFVKYFTIVVYFTGTANLSPLRWQYSSIHCCAQYSFCWSAITENCFLPSYSRSSTITYTFIIVVAKVDNDFEKILNLNKYYSYSILLLFL